MALVTDKTLKIFVSNEVELSENRSSERTLLAAILERAYRDLSPIVESFYRRGAILWFQGVSVPWRGSEVVDHISYSFIVEILELSCTEIAHIQTKLMEALAYEEINKRLSEGKESGEGVSHLVTRKRGTISEENGTILRKQRRFRRYG